MRDSTRPSTTSSASRLLALLGLAVAGAVSAATAVGVYVATDPPRRWARAGVPSPSPESASAGQFRVLSGLLDSLVAPLGTAQTLDSARLSAFVALTGDASLKRSWIAEPRTPVPPRTVVSSTELSLYRAWARSAPLPAFWGYRPGFGAPADMHQLPIRRHSVLTALRRANAADADSALARGDVSDALLRARENLAGARHLIDQPFAIDVMIGKAQIKESAKLLGRVARQANDPALAGAADRLQVLNESFSPLPPLGPAPLLRAARDPASDSLVRLALDTSMHPARRLQLAEMQVFGACFNPREMLFGVRAERRAGLGRLFVALGDIPRAGELEAAFRGTFDLADGESPRARPPRYRGLGEQLLEVVLPDGITARMRWCRRVA
jgi:hypothetical protein